MKISHKIVNNTLYVALYGELDESVSSYVRETLDNLFEKSKMNKVIMDLSTVVFMDSTGIGVLIGRYKKLKAMQVPILLASPSKVVDKVLTLSGIYEIMPKVVY